jgi:hypothetical protein
MQAGDKVVCVEKNKVNISFGETYTINRVVKDSWNDDLLYVEGIEEGFFDWRFRPLEKMQNENFISVRQ